MEELQDLMDEIIAWSSKTFKDEKAESKLEHLKKEVAEAIADIETYKRNQNRDVSFKTLRLMRRDAEMEFADCFMLLIGAASLFGMSSTQLITRTRQKLHINKLREWGEPDEKGVVEHLKDN